MYHAYINHKQGYARSVRLGAVAGVLLVLGLLLPGSAFAAYEPVGIFAGSLTPPLEPGVFPEEVQLGNVGGMAVNINGAGGVPPGTVYAVRKSNLEKGKTTVARFEPEANGKLAFVEAWQVTPKEESYEKCGPVLHVPCPDHASGSVSGSDVDVDQTTGDVYVYSPPESGVEGLAIDVYSPDGSEVITRFGEQETAWGEPTASTPEKIHESNYPGAIAVNGEGDVYLFDQNTPDDFYHRLMEFVPQTAGDYEHYVYAGASHDLGGAFQGEGNFPTHPVADSAGDIYVSGEGEVEEYDPAQSSKAVCKFVEPKGGISGFTADPASGEAFFYDYKNKRVHRLSACNAKGEFTERESFAVSPERGIIEALAFDPVRRFSPSRAPGVLYGASPEAVPPLGGKGEPGQSSLGYIFAQAAESPPVVKSESVSDVTGTSAVLHAQVDPAGSETTYVFQYVTDRTYTESGETFAGAVEAPTGGAVLGAGQAALSAIAPLSGLLPGTEYRYRVVARSNCSSNEPTKVCEDAGAAQSLTTFPVESGSLPDGRAFELVSPIDKNGGQVLPVEPEVSSCARSECKPGVAYSRFPKQSAPDGESVVYEGSPSFSSGGAVIENEYLSKRTGSGWQTTNLTPSLLESKGSGGYRAFATDLSRGLLEQGAPSLSSDAPSEYFDLYTQPTETPSALTPLISDTPLNHTPLNRLPGDHFERLAFAYGGASADLSRVFFVANDALTEQAVGGAEAKNNLYEWKGGQLRSVNLLPGASETTPEAVFGAGSSASHTISSDGSRAFWSSGTGQVYMREAGQRTVEIPDHVGKFLTAAADGSLVLLSDGRVYGHLEAEVPVEEVDLTQGKGGFQGLVGQSEDLSHVYFVDTEILAEDANGQGAKAQEGKDNLYYWHEGTVVFVAALQPQDNSSGHREDWVPVPAERTAEASPDGESLAFKSVASLTGYDNVGPCELHNDAPCSEVFLYDASSGALTCASCDRSGAKPLGQSNLTAIVGGNGTQPRYLLDSGRLYFDSQDSLTPADTNHGVEDVYEYEPNGIGTCRRDAGCVALISSGTGESDSNLLAVDASAKNVFFTTRDRLVPADKDQLTDLYDAREGGGISTESEAESKECQGETCQGRQSASSLLSEPLPGSLAFSGAGNLIAPPPLVNPSVKPKAKTLTRAQQLARALKACKKKAKRQRSACEKTARKKYGAKRAKVGAKRVVGNGKAGR